jgi:hypothetical protein
LQRDALRGSPDPDQAQRCWRRPPAALRGGEAHVERHLAALHASWAPPAGTTPQQRSGTSEVKQSAPRHAPPTRAGARQAHPTSRRAQPSTDGCGVGLAEINYRKEGRPGCNVTELGWGSVRVGGATLAVAVQVFVRTHPGAAREVRRSLGLSARVVIMRRCAQQPATGQQPPAAGLARTGASRRRGGSRAHPEHHRWQHALALFAEPQATSTPSSARRDEPWGRARVVWQRCSCAAARREQPGVGGAWPITCGACSVSHSPSMAATPPAEPRPRKTMTTTNPLSPRRSHRARRRPHAVVLALLATVSLSACGADEDGDPATGAPGASTPAPSPSPSPASAD